MKHRLELVRSWRLVMPAPRRASGRASVAVPRRLTADRLLASRRLRLSIVGLVVLAALLGGGWVWFQDSSFVAVEQVTVTGPSGPDAAAIQAALDSAARSMTTLDVQINRLYGAVSAFPVVKRLQVSTQFPHGMRIHVIEQLPVAVLSADGINVAVAADGTLLRDVTRLPALPLVKLAVAPGGPRLTEPAALGAVAAASAAPRSLLLRVALISNSPQHGLVAQLRAGPQVYLGAADNLAAKWNALLAVLADPGSAGASYIDVTDPGRPAAGTDGGETSVAAQAPGTTDTTTVGGG